MNFATELLHYGLLPDKNTGSTTLPIYQTAAYRQESPEDLEKIFAGQKPGFIYSRIANPTVAVLEQRISKLERGVGAVAFSSDMAAIAAAILNIVETGDEIISGGGLFGGTSNFFRELKSFGVKVRYVNENRVENFAELLTNRTKLIYAETIGNPKLDVTDISALAKMLWLLLPSALGAISSKSTIRGLKVVLTINFPKNSFTTDSVPCSL